MIALGWWLRVPSADLLYVMQDSGDTIAGSRSNKRKSAGAQQGLPLCAANGVPDIRRAWYAASCSIRACRSLRKAWHSRPVVVHVTG